MGGLGGSSLKGYHEALAIGGLSEAGVTYFVLHNGGKEGPLAALWFHHQCISEQR